jgi:class 3 adenylate cyclase
MGDARGDIRYAAHGDRHLAYRVFGDGVPVVYVPSQFIAISDMDEEPAHERFLSSLATFAGVIVFDRQGLGLSDPMAGVPTVDDWAAQILSVLDAEGIESAHLLAHSVGALPAVTLSVTRPDRVRGLILAMAVLAWDLPAGVNRDEMTAGAVPGRQGPVDYVAQLAPSRSGDRRFREWWDRAGRRGASPTVAQALLELQATGTVAELERSVTVPTLVIERPSMSWGMGRPSSTGRAIPGARVVEVPGIDALPWLGDSAALVAEVEEFITGSRRPSVADRSLLTVMFTDVVGSTDAAARLGDAVWRDLLETHDRLVRQELTRCDGREIHAAGDGFLATFSTPSRAVYCAVRLHRAVAQLGLDLRVGIHCGEVEVRGDDLAGIAVHIAARVQALANPGETLITSTAREASVGSDFMVGSRGTHTLKGVPGDWTLFSVT